MVFAGRELVAIQSCAVSVLGGFMKDMRDVVGWKVMWISTARDVWRKACGIGIDSRG